MAKWFFLFLLGMFAWSPFSHAFPELVRHGYVNCVSCHFSPSGGGILTQYGRALSEEILSHRSREGEGRFAYGLMGLPEGLNLGGDTRLLGLYQDSQAARTVDLILMQADLEAQVKYRSVSLVATGGYFSTPVKVPDTSHLISRRHYSLVQLADEWTLRIGKFQPAFGIHFAEHAISVKQGLGWNEGSESYNLEGAFISDRWNAYLTAITGKWGSDFQKSERGASASVSTAVGESQKWGVSGFYGKNSTSRRSVGGVFGIFGFSPKFVLLSEFDFQRSQTIGLSDERWGLFHYQKLSYEVIRGVNAYATGEMSRSDFKSARTRSAAYGLGAQFFPRPHFELNFEWIMKSRNDGAIDSNMAFLLFHFYL